MGSIVNSILSILIYPSLVELPTRKSSYRVRVVSPTMHPPINGPAAPPKTSGKSSTGDPVCTCRTNISGFGYYTHIKKAYYDIMGVVRVEARGQRRTSYITTVAFRNPYVCCTTDGGRYNNKKQNKKTPTGRFRLVCRSADITSSRRVPDASNVVLYHKHYFDCRHFVACALMDSPELVRLDFNNLVVLICLRMYVMLTYIFIYMYRIVKISQNRFIIPKYNAYAYMYCTFNLWGWPVLINSYI